MTKQTLEELSRATTRQAITTRLVDPQHPDLQIVAKCATLEIRVPWADNLGFFENHAAAARELMSRLGWDRYNHLASGGMPDDDGFVFVQIPPPSVAATERQLALLPVAVLSAAAREVLRLTKDDSAPDWIGWEPDARAAFRRLAALLEDPEGK